MDPFQWQQADRLHRMGGSEIQSSQFDLGDQVGKINSKYCDLFLIQIFKIIHYNIIIITAV